ncbi:chemotaxis protein CheB, partial [Kaarinaea lacus]
FNDSGPEGVTLAGSGDNWAKKLAAKLTEMAQDTRAVESSPADDVPFPMAKPQVAPAADANPAATIKTSVTPTAPAYTTAGSNTQTAKPAATPATELNVWVLGASLGGPQAVRQFLAAIQEDLPVVFILAQHIGANHVSLLAEQLNRVTSFEVLPGKTGHQLEHGEVILTPADKVLSITDDSFLALTQAPPATIYSPSIDNVMTEVARCYGEKAGTIVFSGMGDDGARGCEAIAEKGGIVWAQDIASCVVSSMPDQARKTGKVSYSANPEQLAKHLYEYYRNTK